MLTAALFVLALHAPAAPLLTHAAPTTRRPRAALALNALAEEQHPTAAEDHQPTAADLAKFALPTLGAWLISPMMSLIDTGVVGRRASSTALAALGPGTMVSDSCAYLFSFLSVATTNLVATQLAANETSAVNETLATGTRLALLCGGASAAFQCALGRPLLSRYTAARSAALVPSAYAYVRVRALGAPAALLSRVCIATCLATKDSLAPLGVICLSGGVNLLLTLALVPSMGIGGAALATDVAEAVGAAAIVVVVKRKLRQLISPSREYLRTSCVRFEAWVRAQLAPWARARVFVAYARPLLLVLLGKIATYSMLAHVATTAGVALTAAHRILMSVYWFAWPFAEVLSQVAQVYLPGRTTRSSTPLRRTLRRAGVATGAASAAASAALLVLAPTAFTTDAAVAHAIRALVPLHAACIAQLGLMCSMEGTLLARRELAFLSQFYTLNAVAMVSAFAAIERLGLKLRAAWGAMLVFQLARLFAFALRLRRTSGEAEAR